MIFLLMVLSQHDRKVAAGRPRWRPPRGTARSARLRASSATRAPTTSEGRARRCTSTITSEAHFLLVGVARVFASLRRPRISEILLKKRLQPSSPRNDSPMFTSKPHVNPLPHGWMSCNNYQCSQECMIGRSLKHRADDLKGVTSEMRAKGCDLLSLLCGRGSTRGEKREARAAACPSDAASRAAIAKLL